MNHTASPATPLSLSRSLSRSLSLSLTLTLTLTLALACAEDPLRDAGEGARSGAAGDELVKGDRGAARASVRVVVSDPCENPCSLSAEVSGPVVKVRYEADGWVLGSSDAARESFAISYTFNTLGERVMRAVGLGAGGEVLAEGSARVTLKSPAAAAGELPAVPYFYQFANALSPGATCQNTSLAMVLGYLGWRGTPDDITRAYGRHQAQHPSGLAAVFNDYARSAGLGRRLQATTSGSLAGLRAELDRGEPVIIHGYFTSAGHVLVVLGYDEGGYYVNDPAGTWSQSFKGRYSNGWEPLAGRALYYSKVAFERAVATLDGVSYEPLWYSALR